MNACRLVLTLLLTLLLAPAQAGVLDTLSSKLGLGGDDYSGFLDPAEAFILSVDSRDAHTITANLEIADGYYLYRDKFRFALIDAPAGVTLGALQAPPGKVKHDDYFGDMEVYYHQVTLRIPVQRATVTGPLELQLRAEYQGCADDGFCYPPQHSTTSLQLPAAASGAGGDAAPADDLPEQQRYARQLAGDHLPWTLLGFFGLGLLLAFTPCVLPMVPILSGILIGQGQDVTARHGFFISLAYVLMMALTYAVAGVIAGLFGENLQIMFQNPWVIGSFSLLFVLLSLSMFGFYELQLPSRWQSRLNALSNRQHRGSYIGAGVMGLLSALIVGPCVAAPLAGILIYIGMSGDGVTGGIALFVMGLGMGTPLLLLGASAGKLLPRAGGWMESIKRLFGVLLLGLAIWMLERIAPVQVTLLLWAALLIGSAIFLGALERLEPEATGWARLAKALGLMLLIWGGLLIIGAASGARDVFRPLATLTAAAGTPQSAGAAHAAALPFRPVKGNDGLQQALAAARGRPVMLDFYADWCIECKRMERNTFADGRVQALLADAVLLQADVTANDAADQALLKRFGLYGPPATLFFDAGGQERPAYRLVGYMGPEDFSDHLRKALQP